MHEPFLYHGYYDGKEVLFLQQVDDFAVECVDDKVCKSLIEKINHEMTIT